MELRFYGATGTTTGSCHGITFGRSTVLLDCGMYQGRREESYRRNSRCTFDPKAVNAVVLSHAHVDHSGKLPMLVRHGFGGRIHATRATIDLCDLLLRDSAHIMLADAEHLNRMRAKFGPKPNGARLGRHQRKREREDRLQKGLPVPHDPNEPAAAGPDLPASDLQPLYTAEDVGRTLPLFAPHEIGEWFEAAPGMRFRFHEAGHILGATWIEGEFGDGGAKERLVFTGDYGRKGQPILRDPEPLARADVFISESTYGNRTHPPFDHLEVELADAVKRLAARGRGRLLIPAFAVGRTQNILYSLARIFRTGEAPPVRTVVDSPLATAATEVVMRHHECFDPEALEEYRKYQTDPTFSSHLSFTDSVEESKALNEDPRPTILISASGMMESGRILHHLARGVGSPDTEILVVGYQASYTLGRRLLDGAREVKIFGMMHPVRATVTPMLGYSAHADRDGLLEALSPHAGEAGAVFLVHGEDDQRKPLGDELAARGFRRVEQPNGPDPYRT